MKAGQQKIGAGPHVATRDHDRQPIGMIVFVDSQESALIETGDIVTPLKQGLITADKIVAEIGELINGTKSGRTSPEQLTFFKSCGVAVQDAVSAGITLKNSERENLGTIVSI